MNPRVLSRLIRGLECLYDSHVAAAAATGISVTTAHERAFQTVKETGVKALAELRFRAADDGINGARLIAGHLGGGDVDVP